MSQNGTGVQKQTIAVYVPTWLYIFDTGITIFVRGLYRSIKKSTHYHLLKIKPSDCSFASIEEARAFVTAHNIAFVIYHDSRIIPERKKLERGLDYLEACVPFLNTKAVHVADDKFETKRILRTRNIPVLPDTPIHTRSELWQKMEREKMYVGKLHDSKSGWGVKLIQRTDTDFFEYLDGAWKKMRVRDTTQGLAISSTLGIQSYIYLGLFAISLVSLILQIFPLAGTLLMSFSIIASTLHIPHKLEQNFTYRPLMLEPFFGDGTDEFYCLRCTVIGNRVVEAVKKSNTRAVTPNISHGGIATRISLSKEQEDMAIAATQAVGATCTGVDLLYAEGRTVVCEVNVGPIGVYCAQSGVDVGKLLGEYAMQRCASQEHLSASTEYRIPTGTSAYA